MAPPFLISATESSTSDVRSHDGRREDRLAAPNLISGQTLMLDANLAL